jgi:Tol biopolymer transport system component/DNA-binding winged helix-turn-helix (wHTH) protein
MTPKAFDTLLILLEHAGHVVSKSELLRRIWPDSFVEEGGVSRNIHALRKVLEMEGTSFHIETIPKIGYRFVGPVTIGRDHPSDPPNGISLPSAATGLKSAPAMAGGDLSTQNGGVNGRLPPQTSEEVSVESTERTDLSPGGASPRTGKKRSLFLIATVAILVFIVFSLAFRPRQRLLVPSFFSLELSHLTSNDMIREAAISPDGRYLATTRRKPEEGIWIKSTGSHEEQLLVQVRGENYRGLVFGREGETLYYLKENPSGPAHDLYQVPLSGGTPKKIGVNIASPIAFAPDGNRFAFVRYLPETVQSQIVTVSLLSGVESVLVTKKYPEDFSIEGVSWSPDGERIACILKNYAAGEQNSLLGLHVGDGSLSPLSSKTWKGVRGVAWAADGSAILVCAQEGGVSQPFQIYSISQPEGNIQRITNDLSNYRNLSLTADSTQIVTIQVSRFSDLWISPDGSLSQSRMIHHGEGDGVEGLCWAPADRIVFASKSHGAIDLWIIGQDGKNLQPLTANAGRNEQPDVSPDGRYVVFSSNRKGNVNIWRMDLDGRNPVRLTNGNLDLDPVVTPDGLWVIYSSVLNSVPASRRVLWQVPLEGGSCVPLSPAIAEFPAISPDGRQILCVVRPEQQKSRAAPSLLDRSTGELIRTLDIPLPAWRLLRWRPGENLITFSRSQDGGSNLWSISLPAGTPRPITDFKSGQIFAYAWSKDGKYLASARGMVQSNAVLIRNFSLSP